MRFSSVVVFAAFAFLASTSPIDDHSRRSNSIGRRASHYEPPPSTNHDPHDPTFIYDTVQRGKVTKSDVSFRNGRLKAFYPTSAVPWDRPAEYVQRASHYGQLTGLTFNEYDSTMRDYRADGKIELTSVKEEGLWLHFYPRPPPGQSETGPTTSEELHSDGTYVRSLYDNGELRGKIWRTPQGVWKSSADEIPPQQSPHTGNQHAGHTGDSH